MANLLKTSKRGGLLPRLAGARITPGEKYATWGDEKHERGEMPPMLNIVMIDAGPDGDEYEVQFTDDEMLQLTSEWLTNLNRRRSKAAFEARKVAMRAAEAAAREQLEREQRASDTMDR